MVAAKEGHFTWEELELLCLVQIDAPGQGLQGSRLWSLASDLNKETDEVKKLIRGLRRKGARLTMLPNDRFYMPLVVYRKLRPQLEAHDALYGPKNEFDVQMNRSMTGQRGSNRISEFSHRIDFGFRSDRRWRQGTTFDASRRYHGGRGE